MMRFLLSAFVVLLLLTTTTTTQAWSTSSPFETTQSSEMPAENIDWIGTGFLWISAALMITLSGMVLLSEENKGGEEAPVVEEQPQTAVPLPTKTSTRRVVTPSPSPIELPSGRGKMKIHPANMVGNSRRRHGRVHTTVAPKPTTSAGSKKDEAQTVVPSITPTKTSTASPSCVPSRQGKNRVAKKNRSAKKSLHSQRSNVRRATSGNKLGLTTMPATSTKTASTFTSTAATFTNYETPQQTAPSSTKATTSPRDGLLAEYGTIVGRGSTSQYTHKGVSACTSICLAAAQWLLKQWGTDTQEVVSADLLDFLVLEGCRHQSTLASGHTGLDEVWTTSCPFVDGLERGSSYQNVVSVENYQSALTWAWDSAVERGQSAVAVVLTKAAETILCFGMSGQSGPEWLLFDSHGDAHMAGSNVVYAMHVASTPALASALATKCPPMDMGGPDCTDGGDYMMQTYTHFEATPIIQAAVSPPCSDSTGDVTNSPLPPLASMSVMELQQYLAQLIKEERGSKRGDRISAVQWLILEKITTPPSHGTDNIPDGAHMGAQLSTGEEAKPAVEEWATLVDRLKNRHSELLGQAIPNDEEGQLNHALAISDVQHGLEEAKHGMAAAMSTL